MSRMPLVWLSSMRGVIAAITSGSSVRCRRTGASRSIRPRPASSTTAAAVNRFATDPDSEIVPVVSGMPWSRLARP